MADNIRALVPQQPQFDDQQLEIIRKTVAIGLRPEQFLLFIEVCKHYRLNPMARQIYGYQDGKGRMIVQTSIDGFRLMAERTGLYGGQIGPEWCGPDGVWKDVWLEKEPPAAARVGIIRRGFDKPIWGVARYSSYAGTTPIWAKASDVMLAKCAESLGFRKAFPAEMSGLYTSEEMEQAANDPVMHSYSIQEVEADETIKATSDGLYKAALKAKQRAMSLEVVKDDEMWTALLDLLGITEFASGADIAKINGKITELEKAPKQQSA